MKDNTLAVFWIGLNTPSSKNNKEWVGTALIDSERVRLWKKYTQLQFEIQTRDFVLLTKDLPKPLYIELIFIRKQRRTFDYINAAQIIQDMMVQFGWINDDNNKQLKPYFGDDSYDKHNHGCLIRILKTKPII